MSTNQSSHSMSWKPLERIKELSPKDVKEKQKQIADEFEITTKDEEEGLKGHFSKTHR